MGKVAAADPDIVIVLVFVAIGRTAHAHGVTIAGLASTAWPFLARLAVGWLALASVARRHGLVERPGGVDLDGGARHGLSGGLRSGHRRRLRVRGLGLSGAHHARLAGSGCGRPAPAFDEPDP